jgi:Tannase and feruloyl esterase
VPEPLLSRIQMRISSSLLARLPTEAAQVVHTSVLKLCGAQAGVEEGLVTDPPSCKWQPDMIACAQGSSGSDCLNARQVAAVRCLMPPVTNSKGEVLFRRIARLGCLGAC